MKSYMILDADSTAQLQKEINKHSERGWSCSDMCYHDRTGKLIALMEKNLEIKKKSSIFAKDKN